jgi:hypothetical protein
VLSVYTDTARRSTGLFQALPSVQGRVVVMCGTTRQVASDVDLQRIILRILTKGVQGAAGCFQVSTNWLTKGIGSLRHPQATTAGVCERWWIRLLHQAPVLYRETRVL